MSSPDRLSVSPAWRAAVVGALASLPVVALLDRLPDSEATVGGGVMVVGAFVAGAVAAVRATDPNAAGLRAGFLGGVLAVLVEAVAVATAPAGLTAAAWPLSRVAFGALAVGAVLGVAPVFGLVCGRAGGWVARAVASRLSADANPSG